MQGLPKVTVNVNNDRLGKTNQTEDGIVGLVLTGVAVAGADNISLQAPRRIFSLQDAEDIGILDTGSNAFAHGQIKEFYLEAGDGTELWIMLLASTITMTEIVDKDEDYGKTILDAAKGRIRYLGVLRNSQTAVTVTEGLDEDVHNAVPKAQILADFYASQYKPVRIVLDGKNFDPEAADLKDYSTSAFNRVAILLANVTGALNASVGLMLGKIAVEPVQRKVSRVKSGAIKPIAAFFNDGTAIEENELAWDSIHNKGYIFLRSFQGKAGYFFTQDTTLTSDTDDFKGLARIAVIDKATLVSYAVALENLNDEIPLESDGTISIALVKSWQSDIDNALAVQMVQTGNISDAKATIDPSQDIIGTDNVDVKLDVLPVGYSEYITIDLGFTKAIN